MHSLKSVISRSRDAIESVRIITVSLRRMVTERDTSKGRKTLVIGLAKITSFLTIYGRYAQMFAC